MRVAALVDDLLDRSRLSAALPDTTFVRDPAARARGRRRGRRPGPPRRGAPRPAGRSPDGPDRGVRAPRRRRPRSPRRGPPARTWSCPAPGSSRIRGLRWHPDPEPCQPLPVRDSGEVGGRNAASGGGVEAPVRTVVSRIEAAAGTNAALTLVGSAAGGEAETLPWGRIHEDAQAAAAALQAAGRRARRPRRPPRRHLPGVRHRQRRRCGWPARRWSACRCPCGSARSRSSSPRPAAASSHADGDPRRRRRRRSSRVPDPPSPATRPSSTPRRAGRPAPRDWERPARRPRRAGPAAVHQRVDRRPEGRDAAPPRLVQNIDAIVEARRARPPRTAACPGCRCTTTWGSSGC